jgi:hypothetical protein
LPDGKFSNPKFGKFSEGLAMEDIGTYILWTFGLFQLHVNPEGSFLKGG